MRCAHRRPRHRARHPRRRPRRQRGGQVARRRALPRGLPRPAVPAPLRGPLWSTRCPGSSCCSRCRSWSPGGWLGVLATVAALLLSRPTSCSWCARWASMRRRLRLLRRVRTRAHHAADRRAQCLARRARRLGCRGGDGGLIARLRGSPTDGLALVVAARGRRRRRYRHAGPGRHGPEAAPAGRAGDLTVEEGDYLRTRTPALPVTLGRRLHPPAASEREARAAARSTYQRVAGAVWRSSRRYRSWRERLPELDVRLVVRWPGTRPPWPSGAPHRARHRGPGLGELRHAGRRRLCCSAPTVCSPAGPSLGSNGRSRFVEDIKANELLDYQSEGACRFTGRETPKRGSTTMVVDPMQACIQGRIRREGVGDGARCPGPEGCRMDTARDHTFWYPGCGAVAVVQAVVERHLALTLVPGMSVA